MLSSFHYWWLALIVLAVFAGLNVSVYLLRNNHRASYAIGYTIAVYLLIYKLAEYIIWQVLARTAPETYYDERMNFPVEFSAMSYVVYSIFITFRFKKIDAFAVFTAILAGVIYEISWIVAPDDHIRAWSFVSTMAIVNHTLLYYGGIILACNCRSYSVKKTFYQLIIGIGVLVGYSWIIHSFTNYTAVRGKPIIIQITDGSVIHYVAKQTPLLTVIYFVGALILLCLIIAGFYFLNSKTTKSRVKNGGPANFTPDKWIETYVWKK